MEQIVSLAARSTQQRHILKFMPDSSYPFRAFSLVDEWVRWVLNHQTTVEHDADQCLIAESRYFTRNWTVMAGQLILNRQRADSVLTKNMNVSKEIILTPWTIVSSKTSGLWIKH